ncbi:RodZ domain-containing protein [Candidatus Njordibacter sp. Uisw_056]|uniref:RodZ domain-containing protein n=1 Tax=Candidatus Njordibacter sp. Uisw_056 TaxID=3230973 RepID=UPI003D3F4854
MSDLEPLDMQDQPELDGQLPGFPGHLLRQAREEQGLSQKETARDLHLTSKVINAIEEDDFELIPSFVFARGYIRSYARHLGLDGQALVAEFDLAYGVPNNSAKPMSAIRKGVQQSKPGDTWVKLISIVFVVGLVAASIVWWQSQNGSQMLPQLSSGAEQELPSGTLVEGLDTDDANLDLLLLLTNESEVDAIVPEAESIIESEQAQVVVVEPVVDPVAEAATEQAPKEVTDAVVLLPNQAQLVMVFDKDCWVEIKDANGKMVLSDLYSAGDTIEQVITAPIEVLLGRSSGVATMTFDGRTIDLKPHTRKDIARLTLSK